jgi:hypothetical protein
VQKVPDFVKIARPANFQLKLMPTPPTAPNAWLGSTNRWGVKPRV